MRFFIIIFILFCSFDLFAQYDWDSKNWNKESLGFGCSIDGQMTKPVLNMTLLFTEKRFDKIRELLHSNLPVNRFLAVYTLEKLSAAKELAVSEEESVRITEIKNSAELIPFCSGCTFWTEIPLKDLFDDKKIVVYASADNWFNTYYKIYFKKRKSTRGNN